MSSDRAIVLTRPEPANSEFARALIERKIQSKVITLPLAEYVATSESLPDLTKYDAAIVTSRAALRFVDIRTIDLPWIVVGGQSRAAIEAAGALVIAQFATADELATGLRAIEFERVIYFRGKKINRDLVNVDEETNRVIDEKIVYDLQDVPDVNVSKVSGLAELLFPVFSKQSYLRLLRYWERFDNEPKKRILPFSENLYQFARFNRPAGVFEGAILTPPVHPNRTAFVDRIIELSF